MNPDYDKTRIERLRNEVFESVFDYSEFEFFFLQGLKNRIYDKPYAIRIGDAVSYMYQNTSVMIGEDELIVGRLTGRQYTKKEQKEYDLLKKYAKKILPAVTGQASHMTVDYELLLKKGINGIISDINKKREMLDLTQLGDVKKDLFYESCIPALEGVLIFAGRYALKAEQKATECTDENRKKELLTIAKNLRNVPGKPAMGFYEAVQSVHFLTFCLSGKPFYFISHLYQLGRPDRYLLPYYEDDIKKGKITKDFAQCLLDCLGIMLNARIPNGLASGYMVGGRDENGKVVSNDLTRMAMDTVRNIRLAYPGVGLCWCVDTPEEDLNLACEIIGEGHSHPSIFNDDVIAKGLIAHGVPPSQSHNYIHSTCVEITPVASSNVWVASPYMNMIQKLLDVLNKDYDNITDLLDAYFEHVENGIRENLIAELKSRTERMQYTLDPLLSCFVNDCLEKGIDIEKGGARYNWIMPSFVGLSNVVDSITVIEKLIIDNKEISFEDLRKILECNYINHEQLRQKILNITPKYGNDNDECDKYVIYITNRLNQIMDKYQKQPDNYLIPSLFCWIMHDKFGQETGASPDGRLAGFPLGDGSGPAQGREISGPTAAILSATKWDHHMFIGGVAVNMKFTKKLLSDASLGALKALIISYMKRGGFELQINVVDKETLFKAQENPEAYRDLVVRIGGYSDYFVKLSPSMQQEIIARSEYIL